MDTRGWSLLFLCIIGKTRKDFFLSKTIGTIFSNYFQVGVAVLTRRFYNVSLYTVFVYAKEKLHGRHVFDRTLGRESPKDHIDNIPLPARSYNQSFPGKRPRAQGPSCFLWRFLFIVSLIFESLKILFNLKTNADISYAHISCVCKRG